MVFSDFATNQADAKKRQQVKLVVLVSLDILGSIRNELGMRLLQLQDEKGKEKETEQRW